MKLIKRRHMGRRKTGSTKKGAECVVQDYSGTYLNHVPIVEIPKGSNAIYKVYLTKMIDEPFHYDELCTILSTCIEGDKVELHMTTPGGYLDSANRIISHLMTTEADTLAIISGTCASAGTLISLACDECVMMPHSTFMIHNYSGGTYGKGHEMEADLEHMQKIYPKMAYEAYKDFLTTKEIKKVIKGKDIYLDTEQFNERWSKVLEARDLEVQKVQAEMAELETAQLVHILKARGFKVKQK